MLKLNLIDKVMKRFIGILENMGKFLNQVPTKEENANIRQSPLMREKLWVKSQNKKNPARRPSAKKTTTRPKGKRDKANEIFNHPRKDFHA
jgi:hypothetical protein